MRIKPAVIFTLGLLVLAVLAGANASGQVISREEKAQKEIEQRNELERQTLVLLDEIILSAGAFKLPENRCYILANAADLLWEHDEKRARNLYWDALNNLAQLTNALSKSQTTNNSGSEKPRNEAFAATFSLRQELLIKVARRDPQFALDLLQAVHLQSPEQPISESELQLEQGIALEAATRDPGRALQIARASLAKGPSFHALNLLLQLNSNNSELATKFADDLIDKLKTESPSGGTNRAVFASDLLVFSRPAKDSPAEKSDAGTAPFSRKPLALEESQRRELVYLITSDVLSATANGELAGFDIAYIFPEIEQFAPDQMPAMRRKLAEANQTTSAEEKGWNEHNSLVVSGTAEEMLRAAAKASGDLRQSLEREAVLKAAMHGTPEAARELINNQVTDEGRRKHLIDQLDSELIGQAIYKNDVAALEALLPRIRLKEERARAMARIAISLQARGHHDEALKLLDEAQLLIKTDFRSESRTNGLLEVVMAYALVEPSKGFAIVERTIDRANEELALALLATKILRQNGILKKGELVMARSGQMSDSLLFRYGKGVSALATADFNRTKAAADRFQRNELRVMVRLLLVQAILREQGKRSHAAANKL